MKNIKLFYALLFTGLIFSSSSFMFSSNESSQVLNDKLSADNINQKNEIHSTYTLRSLISSSSVSIMSVTEASGTVTVTTSAGTVTTNDKFLMILSPDFSFASDNTVNIPGTGTKTWIVPFDASKTPTIANVGGGGGGGVDKCYKQYCPCKENDAQCTNECNTGTPILVDGKWQATCVVNPQKACTDGCGIKWCEVGCSGGGIISEKFTGPSYLIKADILVFNGTTYN
jgi:hypothetical protein